MAAFNLFSGFAVKALIQRATDATVGEVVGSILHQPGSQANHVDVFSSTSVIIIGFGFSAAQSRKPLACCNVSVRKRAACTTTPPSIHQQYP